MQRRFLRGDLSAILEAIRQHPFKCKKFILIDWITPGLLLHICMKLFLEKGKKAG